MACIWSRYSRQHANGLEPSFSTFTPLPNNLIYKPRSSRHPLRRSHPAELEGQLEANFDPILRSSPPQIWRTAFLLRNFLFEIFSTTKEKNSFPLYKYWVWKTIWVIRYFKIGGTSSWKVGKRKIQFKKLEISIGSLTRRKIWIFNFQSAGFISSKIMKLWNGNSLDSWEKFLSKFLKLIHGNCFIVSLESTTSNPPVLRSL